MEFNNREIASFVVFISFIIYILFAITKDINSKKELYLSLVSITQILFSKHILVINIFFLIYMMVEIWFLYQIKFIDNSILKESIIWFFGAYVLIINHHKIVKQKYFIKKLIFDNLKLLALFQFIFNMYPFNLFVEIILIFSLTLLYAVKIFLETKKIFDDNEKLTIKYMDFILSTIVVIIFLFTFIQVYNNYHEIKIIQNMKIFLLPLILIIFYLPFYYLFVSYSEYEQICNSIDFYTRNISVSDYIKRKVFIHCFLNYSKLKNMHKNINKFQNSDTKKNVDAIFQIVKRG